MSRIESSHKLPSISTSSEFKNSKFHLNRENKEMKSSLVNKLIEIYGNGNLKRSIYFEKIANDLQNDFKYKDNKTNFNKTLTKSEISPLVVKRNYKNLEIKKVDDLSNRVNNFEDEKKKLMKSNSQPEIIPNTTKHEKKKLEKDNIFQEKNFKTEELDRGKQRAASTIENLKEKIDKKIRVPSVENKLSSTHGSFLLNNNNNNLKKIVIKKNIEPLFNNNNENDKKPLNDDFLREKKKEKIINYKPPTIPNYPDINFYLNYDNLDNISENSEKTISYYSIANKNDKKDKNNEWALVLNKNYEEYKDELEKNKQLEKEKKNKLREELNKQMEENKGLKVKEKLEDLMYQRMENEIAEKMRLREIREKEESFDKKSKNLNELNSQMQNLLKHRKIENKKDKYLNKAFLHHFYQQSVQEEKEKKEEKIKRYEKFQSLLKEGQKEVERHKKEIVYEKEEDQKHQKNYTEFLNHLEKVRALEKEKINRKIQEYLSQRSKVEEKYMDFHKKKMEFSDLMATKNNLTKNNLQENEFETENNNKLKHDRILQNVEILKRQMEERQKLKENEKKIDQIQAEIWRKDTEKFYEENRNSKIFTFSKNKTNSEYILSQIGEKETKEDISKMTIHELLQNKPTLKKLATENINKSITSFSSNNANNTDAKLERRLIIAKMN